MANLKRKKMDVDVEKEEESAWNEELFIETLQSVLGRYYYRSTDRLQMKVKPPCYSNLEKCSRNHFKSHDINIVTSSMEQDCRMLQKNRKFATFFSTINNFCLQGIFPGAELLCMLLQMIIDTPESNTNVEEESSAYVLYMSIQAFEMILMQFPPCILQLEPSYSAFLIRQCDLQGLGDFTNGTEGICSCLISSIAKSLDVEEQGKSSYIDSIDTEEELKIMNEEPVKMLFGTFVPEVRLERLFVVLHLIVKLMEFDLAMWLLRHPKKASKSMLKPSKQPLIAKILWPTGDYSITPFMKKCLTVFVRCIDLPEEHKIIFGRLIGLIANAVNLCELQTTSEVQYPCIRQKSIGLAETFMQIITENEGNTPLVTMKIITNTPNPITKMVMIDKFMDNINPETGNMSITKILKMFKNKQWIMQNKISQVEYVKLFVDAMKCWIDIYRLHEVFRSYSKGDADKGPPDAKKAKAPIKERVAEIENRTGKKRRVNFTAINKDLPKILRKYKIDEPIKYNELNMDYSIIGTSDIYQLYVNEFKSVLKLHQMLVTRNNKYPSLFGPWLEVIEEHFGFALSK